MICPQCGHAGMNYLGIGDGHGDFGGDCCDVYVCPNCSAEEIDNCINCDDDESFADIDDPTSDTSLSYE